MPNVFIPVPTNGDNRFTQINANFAKLDAEAVRKQFGKSNGQSLIIGLYDGEHYGMLFYDENGVPVQLIGQAPDDGRMGMWTARPGENVITLLGG